MHGIFFGNNAAELVIEKWKYGYVFIGNYVNEKTINYISKYMLKDDINNREFTGKVLTSAGMGKQYFERGDWKFNRYNGKYVRKTVATRKYLIARRKALRKYWRKCRPNGRRVGTRVNCAAKAFGLKHHFPRHLAWSRCILRVNCSRLVAVDGLNQCLSGVLQPHRRPVS